MLFRLFVKFTEQLQLHDDLRHGKADWIRQHLFLTLLNHKLYKGFIDPRFLWIL